MRLERVLVLLPCGSPFTPLSLPPLPLWPQITDERIALHRPREYGGIDLLFGSNGPGGVLRRGTVFVEGRKSRNETNFEPRSQVAYMIIATTGEE